jgi:hypothetical protein
LGLADKTTYHARAVAVGDNGITFGADFTFTTGWDANHNLLPDEWELSEWGNTIGHSAENDDDRDGVQNLYEYMLGRHPLVHDGGGPAFPIALDEGRLSVTLPKRPHLTLIAEVSSDLKKWAPAPVVFEDATTIVARDDQSTATAPTRFMRVRAAATP